MRAWIFSDLHIERWRSVPPLAVQDADVCLCAGNVCDGGPERAVSYLGEHVSKHMPVILVPGNQDYYRSSILEGSNRALATAAEFPDVHFLDRGIVSIGGHRFVGATSWDSFEKIGCSKLALCLAQRELKDYAKIKMSKRPLRWFSSTHARRLNLEDSSFLSWGLEGGTEEVTVVVTHHAPSWRSAPSEITDDGLHPDMISGLEREIVRYRPVVWVHGHYNNRSDYYIGDTRVICNPRGYPQCPVPDFDPALVVDLGGPDFNHNAVEICETTGS
ncbi:metallophosphoesterase [Rhizobium leguminosarum]|uniref:metallophosphoesterase n=1 Tax=Rhizobium leguminosarum TaxID=384 RepID=UPI00103BF143|nr:metallophosphoesterase [Rhizobium leguminosarum]MBB4344437.1 putative phosphodiesterase [Rhizobium leguminosarum]MBB6297509.1 putative phosphodiesterase [Rhizobium leguminosarum]TCA52855.1 hypothetical protein E0H71_16440 [Rhizobium leguminosarum bv. viciae]TCA68208.1 hypothetical protein E0H69_30655 [Rhizobium leguminosarum bv. viciae]